MKTLETGAQPPIQFREAVTSQDRGRSPVWFGRRDSSRQRNRRSPSSSSTNGSRKERRAATFPLCRTGWTDGGVCLLRSDSRFGPQLRPLLDRCGSRGSGQGAREKAPPGIRSTHGNAGRGGSMRTPRRVRSTNPPALSTAPAATSRRPCSRTSMPRETEKSYSRK